MTVKLIAAQSLNGVIGREGRIPWRLPTDMAFFRKVTEGNIVVMGRKTYESIGKPLKNRRNIVLSRTVSDFGDGVEVFDSIQELTEALEGVTEQAVYVIGGEALYEAFMPSATTVYLTIVEAVVSGDAHFPRLQGDWDVTLLEAHAEPPAPKASPGGQVAEGPWYPHRIYEIRRAL